MYTPHSHSHPLLLPDRYKTSSDMLICNKTPLFLETGFCQPFHIPLQHGYTGWNSVNRHYVASFIITVFVLNLQYKGRI